MRSVATTLLIVLAVSGPAPARAAERLTDKDIKAIVTRLDESRDRFEDQLDGKVKNNIVRGPSGEVNVAQFLDDFQSNVDRIEERLQPDYAASAEVATVLRQATTIERFMRQLPASTRGLSEWNRLVDDARLLSTAYGATFPLAENAPVRRIGDRELSELIEALSEHADRLKNSLENELRKNTTVAPQEREAIVKNADQLKKDAKSLASRVKDGEPSSAEADRLLTAATRLGTMIGGRSGPASSSIWGDVSGGLRTVAGAYGMPWPR